MFTNNIALACTPSIHHNLVFSHEYIIVPINIADGRHVSDPDPAPQVGWQEWELEFC